MGRLSTFLRKQNTTLVEKATAVAPTAGYDGPRRGGVDRLVFSPLAGMLHMMGTVIAIGGLVSDVVGGVRGGIDAGTARAAGLADDAKQAMISSVTQNAPTAGSFVIPSMNGASLAHLPSSMSHA